MDIIDSSGFEQRELWDTRQVSYPLEGNPTHLVITCHYVTSKVAYSRGRIGLDAFGEDPTLVLADEQIEKITGDLVYFLRKWANVPTTYSDCTTFAYTFPGFVEDPTHAGRSPFSQTILARVQHDFFLTSDPTKAKGGVKILEAQTYTQNGNPVQSIGDVDYIGGAYSPTRSVYQSWVLGGREIIAQDSTIERYLGNIWKRSTLLIKAK